MVNKKVVPHWSGLTIGKRALALLGTLTLGETASGCRSADRAAVAPGPAVSVGGDGGAARDVPLVAPGPSSVSVSSPYRFGPSRKDDCTAVGFRQISAPLRNVPGGIDARTACLQTPRNV